MNIDAEIAAALKGIQRQQFDVATKLLTDILAGQPGHVPARWLLVQTLQQQGLADRALEQLRILLIHTRKDLPAIDRVAAHLHQSRYPLSHALDAYKKYLDKQPKSANAAFNYAWYLARDGQFEAAIRSFEHALSLGINAPEEAHLNIATICMDHLYARDRAREHLNKALALNGGYAGAYYNLGNLAEQEGDRELASSCFESCLRADPGNVSALARLAETRQQIDRDDPLLARLEEAAKDSDNSDLHFALGKAYEQLGDYTAAWRSFAKGNELDGAVWQSYEPTRVAADFDRIIALAPIEPRNAKEGAGNAPVFICGMFRSGSTLLEQVLASHPRFVAGGESEFFPRLVARHLPEYPEGADKVSVEQIRTWQRQHEEQLTRLASHSRRPTDKRPDNLLYLGLIKSVVPAAKFVVTERDWRDIATSVFSVRLGPSQAYARSLRDIRHYIDLQSRLIDHWESLLGPDLIRIRYENLVRCPEETITGLLSFLGESWDESCLDFHELRSSVRTASVWQVREPMHSKSIGRWKKYRERFVGVFGDELGD